MWVIVANRNLNLHRDNRISELIGGSNKYEYISKRSSNSKYNTTLSTQFALMFKTESGANRIVQEFNNTSIDQKKYFSNKFSWIYNYVLSVRKLTNEEWIRHVDIELSMLENRYQKQKIKLLSKKTNYK